MAIGRAGESMAAPAPPAATRAPANVPPSGAGIKADGGKSASASSNAATSTAAASDTLSVILVTAGYDHTIRFWEAWSGVCSRTVQHADSQVNRLAISPDKRFLAAAAHNHVRLYDCSYGGLGSTSAGASSTSGVNGAASGQNGNHHGGGNPIATFDGHQGNVTSLAWHCDAKWLVTGSEDGTLKIWDTRTSRPQRVYDHRNPVNDVVVHPNQGELVSCDQGGSVKVWDLSENGCSHELVPEEEVPIRSVTVASDGSCLVAGNNKGNVYVWRIQNGGYEENPMDTPGGSGAAPSSSSPRAASTPTPATPSGDFTDLQPVTKFQAHDKYLTRCVLSPDVRWVLILDEMTKG
jgi:G protein beta subunit-like protein